MVKCTPALAVALMMLAGGTGAARAQDASFGCKVLLCAAATNPSWSGIPYCVPVMTQLFSQLKFGGAWPVCSEGRASGLGREPYMPCPKGESAYAPAANATDSGPVPSYVIDAEGPLCGDPKRMAKRCGAIPEAGEREACDPLYQPSARALRAEPYFVDITTGGTTSRFYFSLQGY